MTREARGANGTLPPTYVDQFNLADISDELLDELQVPLERAYHNAHMYADLVEDIGSQPDVFRIVAARLSESPHRLVGVSVVETKPHDFIDYLGLDSHIR